MAALGRIERNLLAPLPLPSGTIPNNYAPFFAVALVPFAALPYTLAYYLWLTLNALWLGISLRWLARTAHLGPWGQLIFTGAAALSVPVIATLVLGQVSFLLLILLSGCFLMLREHRDFLAGSLLALTLFKPQYALPFLLLLFVLNRRRALVGFVGGAVILAVAPLPILGPAADLQYLHALLAATHYGPHVGGFAPRWNDSFAGFAQLLLPEPVARVTEIGPTLAALGFLAYAVRRIPFDHAFGLTVIVALLTSQHVLVHDLSLLLIPATVMLQLARPRAVALLTLAYFAIPTGYLLAASIPLQLATLVLCVMLGYLSRPYLPDKSIGTRILSLTASALNSPEI